VSATLSPFGGDVATLHEATRDETSLRRFLHGLPGVDQVGAEARAADAIDKDPRKHGRYLIEEAGGLLDAKDLKISRILNAPPEPYTRERFDHTYQWTVGWGLVQSGATFENTVDNRAWQ